MGLRGQHEPGLFAFLRWATQAPARPSPHGRASCWLFRRYRAKVGVPNLESVTHSAAASPAWRGSATCQRRLRTRSVSGGIPAACSARAASTGRWRDRMTCAAGAAFVGPGDG
jgi:hypothetical protein